MVGEVYWTQNIYL